LLIPWHCFKCTGLPCLSAVGDDGEGIRILEETGKAGVKMEQIIISGEHPTGIYLAILDENGEMEVAVSDMKIFRGDFAWSI